MTDALDEGPAAAGPDASASMIEAAQRASAAGNYVEAERLLREAADLQEAALGPSHPHLATTINNLAFVCERTGNFDEAERGYRRAHALAVASLSPGHPFIKTSLSNLMDFCEARGIPIWTRPATPVEDDPLPDDSVGAPVLAHDDVEPPSMEIAPEVVNDSAIVDEPAVGRWFSLRMMAAAALVVAAVVVVVLARQGRGTTMNPSPSPVPSPAPSAAPDPGPNPAPSPGPSPAPGPREASPAPSAARGSVTVLKAQLCTALEKRGSPDWQCTPASGILRPATYMFYTRLLTPEATRVEHRWYFNGRVHQVIRLRVPPNRTAGYRTFSSNRVIRERAGDWKVELRAADGTLLDQASFRVR